MTTLEQLNVVSDFDGAITNVWKEAETYTTAYGEILARRLGMDKYDLAKRIIQAREVISQSPGVYGWEYNGLIVAPAEADPYLMNQTAVNMVIKELRQEGTKIAIPTPEETATFLDSLHHEAYPKAGVFFRDQAKEFIQELHADTQFTIVTNAKTDNVRRKLIALLGERGNDIQVVGDARKYEIDQGWVEFPEYNQPEGFPRKVYLRRRKYNDVLDKLGTQVVFGDIYELDLALPEQKGKRTVLVLTPHTPKYEVAHYSNHINGSLAATLPEAVEKIKKS